MTLATIDLDMIANYLFKLYGDKDKARSPEVIGERINDCKELLEIVNLSVEPFYSADGQLFEVRVYQIGRKRRGYCE